MFYRSPGSRQGHFKMPAYKPPVPLEDVFSQVEAEFETSYLEVSDYVEMRIRKFYAVGGSGHL